MYKFLTLLTIFIRVVYANDCYSNPCQTGTCGQNTNCKGDVDLVILLDGSGSVGDANFDLQKRFIEEFVNGLTLGQGAYKIELIQFSDTFATYSQITFFDALYNGATNSIRYQNFITKVRQMQYVKTVL